MLLSEVKFCVGTQNSSCLKLDFFVFEANTTCDGDKESDGEDVEADNGNSSEDLRKVITIS